MNITATQLPPAAARSRDRRRGVDGAVGRRPEGTRACSLGARPPCSPLKGRERYSATRVEANAFTLEKTALPSVVARRCAECALCIHDPLPRNRRACGQRMERVPHEAGVPR
jgi:hypothetical protein